MPSGCRKNRNRLCVEDDVRLLRRPGASERDGDAKAMLARYRHEENSQNLHLIKKWFRVCGNPLNKESQLILAEWPDVFLLIYFRLIKVDFDKFVRSQNTNTFNFL